MADLAVGVALDKVSTFLTEEAILLGGLRREVEVIGTELQHIKSLLEKMPDLSREGIDPQLDEWIRQVRDVCYDTEDIVDEFVFASHRSSGFLGSLQSIFQLAKNPRGRQRVASKLGSVNARIKKISEAGLRYGSYSNTVSQVRGSVATITNKSWRQTRDDGAHLVEKAVLVGIDGPKEHLISQLLDDVDSQLKVIAVVGMGGLGKTTLVKQVFEDAAVRKHFQILLWVYVSDKHDFRDLLKQLIQQLNVKLNEPIPLQTDSMDVFPLKDLLKDFLRRGRYVIVFDDVWDEEFWNAFKFVLPQNSFGGNRVMFTTRDHTVASSCTTESQGHVYIMEHKNFVDSWDLLCRKIFKDGSCPDHLRAVAEGIVNKCGGLPLAILAVAGLLASKDPGKLDEWKLIQDRLTQDSVHGDFYGALLSLSYNDLPYTLKTCFLYLGIWTRGCNISSHRLIQLWVAEGFAEQKGEQSAEDVARDCLKQLTERSLVQVNKVSCNENYDEVHIHDILHALIESLSERQNIATIVTPAGWPPGKVARRIVFHGDLLRIPSPDTPHELKLSRSIINIGKKKSVPKAVLSKLLTSKLLTVLDLRGMDLDEAPKQIFKLFHLRFLGLSGRQMKSVPSAIKKLKYLQYLILEGTNVNELPMEIQELHKLSCLELSQQVVDCVEGQFEFKGFRAPCGMGQLLELQNLHAIDAARSDSMIVFELGKLSKLRNLWITNLRREDGKEFCSSLEKLHNLQELVVTASVNQDEPTLLDLNHCIVASSLQTLCLLELYGRLEVMPPWLRNLPGLESITLNLSNLADDPLETLQHLPSLFEVKLTDAYQGESLRFKAGRFLKLKKLSLQNMDRLKWVVFEKGAMPGISQLQLVKLPLLEELPVGIEHLRQLQLVELLAINSQLINKLENEENFEEGQKILHVPQVTVGYYIDEGRETHQLSRKKKAQW